MASVPETGFYFEPILERLALLSAGAQFPSDEEWAYVGDPDRMTIEDARREIAVRWPQADAGTLVVEGAPGVSGGRR